MTKSITKAERRATIDEIVASFGLEGIVHSDEELALMERYVEGASVLRSFGWRSTRFRPVDERTNDCRSVRRP